MWSCPECSGAENPENSAQSQAEAFRDRSVILLTGALKWLLSSLRGDGKSKSVWFFCYMKCYSPLQVSALQMCIDTLSAIVGLDLAVLVY